MFTRKKITSACLVLAAVTGLSGVSAIASTSHFANSSAIVGEKAWSEAEKEWETVAVDFTKVSIEPGRTEKELNFAWMTKKDSKNNAVVYFGTDKKKLKKYTGKISDADSTLTDGEAYVSNKVTVSGIKPETTYYYQVEKNGVKSEINTYESKSNKDVKIIFVGDPQIGASKGQTVDGNKLVADSGVANTAARNDMVAWDRTLDIATEQNKDVNFIISAGDQVNKTGQPKEEEFAGYLNASALASLPVATTIGNHDSLTADYKAHFNVPNPTKNGETKAGGDYYYSYGDALFIVLNTNNYNVAEHEKTLKEAIASDKSAKWRIVTIHQDIYGAGKDHSETDGMILRTQLTPIFDKYDIDVVLQGHDHSYSRSKLLHGDGLTHGKYEFRKNAEGTDYDWSNAYNVETDEKIPLYPEEGNTDEEKLNTAFRSDNNAYCLNDVQGNKVVNPKGTLYMTSNSASGSKYYELNAVKQDFLAERSQNWLPSYSVIEITNKKFKIDTYQITDDGKTEKIDKTFTIIKK